MGKAMTDEQAIHAIWELLSEEEQDSTGMQTDTEENWTCERGTWHEVYWKCMETGTPVADIPAHRSILDAAREVLDLAKISIERPEGNYDWHFLDDCMYVEANGDFGFDTRTLCTYHALAWLKGMSE